ncbi:MAG: hypothetical protein HS104_09845 [Polyangiaceae bacterium]|nr:hypothetical protein [Polyangiaceae bacterium]MCE7890390.1 hypothetical protein [Sorangiineae bacterium PRO1]MCL4754388.1 hypothetical protein [Myxococcales bacterium]
MQKELGSVSTKKQIQILGVNGNGLESGNASMTAGRTLPWLQDTLATDVWKSWAVEYRDVVVLDEENRPVAVYNLTTYDLGNPTNFAQLKSILVGAANAD